MLLLHHQILFLDVTNWPSCLYLRLAQARPYSQHIPDSRGTTPEVSILVAKAQGIDCRVVAYGGVRGRFLMAASSSGMITYIMTTNVD